MCAASLADGTLLRPWSGGDSGRPADEVWRAIQRNGTADEGSFDRIAPGSFLRNVGVDISPQSRTAMQASPLDCRLMANAWGAWVLHILLVACLQRVCCTCIGMAFLHRIPPWQIAMMSVCFTDSSSSKPVPNPQNGSLYMHVGKFTCVCLACGVNSQSVGIP